MSARPLHRAAAVAAAALAACGGPTLSDAIVLDASGAYNPTVSAVAGTEAAYVAWVSTEGHGSDVWLARVEADGTTTTPVRVNDVAGDAAPHLQAPARVAVGPDGSVYVAWQNNRIVPGRSYPASDLRFARSGDGGRTFTPAVTINDDAGGPPSSHTFHDLLVTPSGAVVAAWLDGRPGPAAAAHVAHGMGASPDESGPTVRVAVSHDGGRTFGPETIVDRDACPCCRIGAAAAPDGAIHIAWRKVYTGDVRDIVVSSSHDGGASWSAPARVHHDGWVFAGCPHAGPALAVDGSGRLHAAWYTGREGGSGLYHAAAAGGGGRALDPGPAFGEAESLVTGEAVPPSQAALAVDGRGSVWAAWEERSPTGHELRLARGSESGRFPGGAIVGIRGTNPAIAGTASGVVVAWLAGDSVLVARAGPG